MILVTGGAGFIGSQLVKELNRLGEKEIVIVDRLEKSSNWKNLRSLKFSEYIHADEFFSSPLWEVFPFRAVYHMGACSSTTEQDMDFLYRNNTKYTRELFLMCAKHDVRLIYASSAATYGDGEFGYSDDHSTIDRLMPLNRYGYSKHLADLQILEDSKEKAPSFWAGLKCFNVFGPGEGHKDDMRSLVHKAFEQIRDTGKVKLFKSYKEGFSDGKQLRDFVYVKDVVKAMILMMKKGKKTDSGIYNLGTGEANSFWDLASHTFSALGREVNIELIEMPESIRSQYQYYTKAQMEKFFSHFPEFQFTSFAESISDYVVNHLQKGE